MERVYQYIWKHGLAAPKGTAGLKTVDGRPVSVVYPGRYNTDAGPDFIGARLKIGGEDWCGNVEIHVKASDWDRHRHSSDPAYSNVILHVVGVDDRRIPDGRGGYIAQAVLAFPESFIRLYSRLSEKISAVGCEDRLSEMSALAVTDWTESLAMERLQIKAKRVLDTLRLVENDWERACFIVLARALGFSLNAEPMEMLARSLPLSVAAIHSDDGLQLNALMFGQAGLLDPSVNIYDDYYRRLCREYVFLARKYELRPIRPELWKYARTRPQNFPARRIAMLAAALKGGFRLMRSIIDHAGDIEEIKRLFDWKLDDYWTDHIDFGNVREGFSYELSEPAKNLLAINVAAPLVYAYGAWTGHAESAEQALSLWENIPAENNMYIRQWRGAGIECDTAARSQALLHLRKEYCERNRCLDCRFGHALLRKEMNNEKRI